MHRTVKVSYYGYKVCGSQRDKDKIVAYRSENASQIAKEPSKDHFLTRLSKSIMGVLSDDFATVDLREDYANLSLPKEAKFKRCRTVKTNERKHCAAEKAAADPQAG